METLEQERTYNATSRKIVATAAQLFMQRGYRAVSINDIVNAAGVTKPTLYYYFPDKGELFVQMGLNLLASLHAAMKASLVGKAGCAAQLIALAEVLLTERDGDIRMMRHEMQEHLDRPQRRRLAAAFHTRLFVPINQVMQAGIDAGELAGHSAPELAWLFLSLMEAFHGQLPGGSRHGQLDQLDDALFPMTLSPETVVSLFLYGVARKKSY
jgi:AcrR family transcriptional regulator